MNLSDMSDIRYQIYLQIVYKKSTYLPSIPLSLYNLYMFKLYNLYMFGNKSTAASDISLKWP